jgi:hypothetical protein
MRPGGLVRGRRCGAFVFKNQQGSGLLDVEGAGMDRQDEVRGKGRVEGTSLASLACLDP